MRVELIHPLLVHFPLALLLIGAALRFVSFIFRRSRFGRYLLVSSWTMLFIGVCFAWMAVLAGEFAEDIVKKGLCDREILKLHKDFAYLASILFSFALFLDVVKAWLKSQYSSFLIQLLTVVCAILFSAASLLLILVGGFGANLVYEQGAAVEKSCY